MFNAKLKRRVRGKIETIAEILEKAKKPIKKTHLMYKCNLSSIQINDHLDFMRLKGLISREEEGGITTYQTTKDGLECLRSFENIERWLGKTKGTSAETSFGHNLRRTAERANEIENEGAQLWYCPHCGMPFEVESEETVFVKNKRHLVQET